ncbi:hypothetical protein BKA65DRAFT_203165 [Rhexocercosporidium sp. MPI-PUGE-AT-0058]|nr:hypothetical protein BKA65DRAFT_203165 [Rhexocercosporidium sp. MPI-PUGE-AT-0058]
MYVSVFLDWAGLGWAGLGWQAGVVSVSIRLVYFVSPQPWGLSLTSRQERKGKQGSSEGANVCACVHVKCLGGLKGKS